MAGRPIPCLVPECNAKIPVSPPPRSDPPFALLPYPPMTTKLSILKIIIGGRPFLLRDALLLLIQFHHHAARRGLLRFLVLALLDEAGEPQTDALAAGVGQGVAPGLVARAEREIGGLDLPDEAGFEPDVGLVLGHGRVGVEGLGPVDDRVLELGMQVLEHGLGEARADVAHRFIHLARGVVASQQEGAVHRGALALAEVRPQHNQVQRVADAGQVILFHLEPVPAPLAGLVAALGRVEHLHHQPLAGRFDAFVEQGLDLFQVARVAVLGEGEFPFHFVKSTMKEFSPLAERSFDDGLKRGQPVPRDPRDAQDSPLRCRTACQRRKRKP